MARPQRKYLSWIIAACVVLAIPTWLVIQAVRGPTREVMFLLKFSDPVRPNVVTQDEIDAVLGGGHMLTFSDTYGSREKNNVVKIVGLQVRGNLSDADIATKLERLRHVTTVEVMTRKR
jgi:hypothetical protein